MAGFARSHRSRAGTVTQGPDNVNFGIAGEQIINHKSSENYHILDVISVFSEFQSHHFKQHIVIIANKSYIFMPPDFVTYKLSYMSLYTVLNHC